MQIHELNERKVRQQNRAKAGIASQLIKKAQQDAQTNLAKQAQQPVQQPVATQQAATLPAQQKPLTKLGAIKNAFVDSTRGTFIANKPGVNTAPGVNTGTVAPDMTAELSKIGITDRQVAGIGKILQQANNLNTRLTRTGDPAVDKFLQAMGYNVR